MAPISEEVDMRGTLPLAAAGLMALLATGTSNGDNILKPSTGATCGDHGTAIHFEKNPSLAAKKALKEEKLVMVLHVSGDFENPAFT
jgi:hypothetical protein